MGTTAEKLTYLNTTKQNLKTVINTTGAGLTDESTFRSYANVLNDKILGAINGDVDLFEEYPKVSGNGADLSLNGVVEGKMSITPQGNSSQDGEPTPTTPIPVKSVTGENSLILQNANLFDGELEYGQLNQSNGNPQGTATDRKRTKNYVNVENINEVTLSFSVITSSSAYGRFFLYDKEYNMLSNTQIAGNTKTVSIENAYYVKWWTSDTVDYETLMLVKGSTAPSEYVEHEEQNYQLSFGNMEFNSSPDGTIRDGIYGSSDVSYNLFNLNQFLSNTGIGTDGKIISATQNNLYYIPVKYGQNYKMSFTNTSATGNTLYGFCDELPSIDGNCTYNVVTITNLNGYVFTPTSATNKYLCIRLNRDNQLAYLSNIQITEGSEVKPYFPYGQVGMWYKREYIGKVVLNGSESWTFVSNSAMKFSLNINGIAKPVNQNTLPKMLSDNFRESTWNNAINSDDDYLMVVSTSNEILRIKDNDFSTLADFKAWLSTHNTIIYYPLAEYTDIPITDTTLITQLNDIYNNAHSYNGVTNITTTYEDGNKQMYLDIEALKNVWEVTE